MPPPAEKLHLSQPPSSFSSSNWLAHRASTVQVRTSTGLRLTAMALSLTAHADVRVTSSADFLFSSRAAQEGGPPFRLRGTSACVTILDPEFTRLGSFLRNLFALAPVCDLTSSGHERQVMTRYSKATLERGYTLGAATRQNSKSVAGTAPTPTAASPPLHASPIAVANRPAGGPQVPWHDWPDWLGCPWVTDARAHCTPPVGRTCSSPGSH